MQKLVCSEGCGCKQFLVKIETDQFKQPMSKIENIPTIYFHCVECGAIAHEENPNAS